MAYKIQLLSGPSNDWAAFYQRFVEHFQQSRFNVVASLDYCKQPLRPRSGKPYPQAEITLKARLKSAKEYCGNHPGACALSGHQAHRRTKFLEGADWVELNDEVNQLLDSYGISANVSSRPGELREPLVIRKGLARRIRYLQHYPFARGNAVWDGPGEPADFENYLRQVAPPSEFDPETPGSYPALNHAVIG